MRKLARRAASFAAVISTLAWSRAFATDCGIIGGSTVGDKCKTGEWSFEDIPKVISYATNVLLGFTGTISMIAIIFGGYKYAIGSSQGDTTKGKEAIIYGIVGFIVSALAWFIVRLVLDNL